LANHFGDYRCPSEKLGFDTLIAFMFLGAAVGFLCLTLFGETVGKKLLMQINVATYVVGLVLTIFCVDLYMAGAGLFLAALGINNAYIICFYFIIETCADENREKFSVICQAFYGVGVILDILWYWWIADWQIILGACFLAPAVVVLVVLSLFVRDTPACLVLRNDSAVALRDFQKIASMNGVVCGIVEEEIIDAKEHF
jgi:MFS family permease